MRLTIKGLKIYLTIKDLKIYRKKNIYIYICSDSISELGYGS